MNAVGYQQCEVKGQRVYTLPLDPGLHNRQPHDIFLELGNGAKFLSRGYVPDVPVVTTSLTMKIGLTFTHLLHEVDLMLGINWLQLVNHVVD